MESWRKPGLDDFAKRIKVIVGDPSVETEHLRVDEGRLIEKIFHLAQLLLNPLGRLIEKLEAKPGHLSPLKRHKNPHPRLKRSPHGLRDEIVKRL